MADDSDVDENQTLEERLKKMAKQRVVPMADQPGPPQNEGDNSPNPLPDNQDQCGGDGGDPGRE
jgi:hypothetical protein